MTDQPPSKREFFEYALEHMKYEHGQLSDAWKDVDNKAQGTATIAGVFLAAAFAFVRNTSFQMTSPERIILCVAVAFLVAAIVLSAASMLIRSVFVPLTGAQVAGMVANVMDRPPQEATQRYNGLLVDTIDVWATVNGGLRQDINIKAARLAFAQRALLASAIAVLIITVVVLVDP